MSKFSLLFWAMSAALSPFWVPFLIYHRKAIRRREWPRIEGSVVDVRVRTVAYFGLVAVVLAVPVTVVDLVWHGLRTDEQSSPIDTSSTSADRSTSMPWESSTSTSVVGSDTTVAISPLLSGVGDDVVEVPAGEWVMAAASYSGEGRFAVDALDGDGQFVDSVFQPFLVGGYEGVQLLGPAPSSVRSLSVRAEGEWTIELLTASAAPSVGERFTGEGDSVVLFEGSAGTALVECECEGPAWVYSGDGYYLVPSQFGSFQVEEAWRVGPMLVEVTANGVWSIEVDTSRVPPSVSFPAGTALDAAVAVEVDECIVAWVAIQRFVVEVEIPRPVVDERQRGVLDECDQAAAALEESALRSPSGSPVSQLRSTVSGIVLMTSSISLNLGPCEVSCAVPADQRDSYMQFQPDTPDIPTLYVGYLGNSDPAELSVTTLPNLTLVT